MMKALSVTMCLMLPMAAFAEDAVAPAPPVAPAADQPTQAALTPTDAATAPNGATEGTRACGMHRGCHGGGGKAKFIVIGGVVGTVLTAAAVGLAVGVAAQNRNQGQVPR